MNRTKWIVVVAVIGVFFMSPILGGSGALAADSQQTRCPVMDGPVDKEQYVDYQGKRIYFCCSSCLEEFKKDPEKYLKKMKEEGVTPEFVKAK
jgi:YHS domain-containing protein